jgi:tetratricopeptide (TPR) repeat protein
MEEFTHSLRENGTIRKENDRYVLNRNISELDVPDTIQGIIAARMDRLEDNLKRTMQVASVIGRDFAYRVLESITGMREELKSYLLNLQGLEFIFEKSLFPELEYIFKHALTRDVAYNSLLQQRRKEIHEQIGQAIENIYSDRLEEFYEMLAYHYSKSENLKKSSEYLKLSGQKAEASYSRWEACRFFKEAISMLRKMKGDKGKINALIEIHVSLGDTLFGLSFPDDSLDIMREGERLAKSIGDEKNLAKIYSRIGAFYTFKKGDLKLAEEYAEKSFYEADKIQDFEMMIEAAGSLSATYINQGEYTKLIDMNSKVIDLMEKTGKEIDFVEKVSTQYSWLCGMTALSLGLLGNFEEGEAVCEKRLTVSSKIGLSHPIGVIELFYSYILNTKGDGKRCVAHSKDCIKYSEDSNIPLLSAFGWCLSGTGYHHTGDISAAREHIKRGISIQTELGVTLNLCSHYNDLSLVHCDSGDFNNAHRCAQKALEMSQTYNEIMNEGTARICLGRVLGKMDQSQFNEAEESILRGMNIHEDIKAKPLLFQGNLFLGELYAYAGQMEKAIENLTKAESEFKDMGIDYWLARTYAVYSEMYKIDGDIPTAKKNLNKAIEILKECGADGWVEKYEKELAAIS